MINKKDQEIIQRLRKNSRIRLTKISRETGIPVSTIFDKIKSYEGNLIVRNTILINFEKMGYNIRVKIILKVDKKQKKEIGRFLELHQNINSLDKINNGYDYLIEAIFSNIKECEEFIEQIEEQFKILEKQTYYTIEELKREVFFINNNLFSEKLKYHKKLEC